MELLEKIKNLVSEWLNTFSNKPSFLSSKRIERFLVFTVMLVSSAYFLFKNINACGIDSTGLMIVVGGWLGYAGFNVIQGRKDSTNE